MSTTQELPAHGYTLNHLLQGQIPTEDRYYYVNLFYLDALSTEDLVRIELIRDWVLEQDEFPICEFLLLARLASWYSRLTEDELLHCLMRPHNLLPILHFQAEEQKLPRRQAALGQKLVSILAHPSMDPVRRSFVNHTLPADYRIPVSRLAG